VEEETVSRYAEGTSVSMEKSRAEIERDLGRYGASHFGYMTTPEGAEVMFQAKGVQVRMRVKFPPAAAYQKTATGRLRHGEAAKEAAREAEVRRLWRALALVIKAKLEAVGSGISTFEREFLADILTKDGRTIGEHLVPRLAEAVSSGRLLTAGSPP
jgi:hypothetical protein